MKERVFIPKQCMCNWAGKINFIFFILFFSFGPIVLGQENDFKFTTTSWDEFAKEVEKQKESDRRNGISYLISGSLALAGGIVGNAMTDDAAEKGIYTVFQTIGVASIGYGYSLWQVGGEERALYQTLQYTRLTPEQRSQLLRAYNIQKKERENKIRIIRAVTHGLIAGLNIYNASEQKQDGLKNSLYFIGGVNLLASISFTFDF